MISYGAECVKNYELDNGKTSSDNRHGHLVVSGNK